jgi:choline monooxygenase
VTYVYHLFPNVMIGTFPDQVLVIVIDPVDVEHSTVTIYALASEEAARKRSEARASWVSELGGGGSLLAQAGIEDNEMSEGVQRGLRAGANTFVEFGTHESALGHFHATLDRRLASFAQ